MSKTIIYLDNAATTPIDPRILPIISENNKVFANASSLHKLGRISRKKLEQARQKVAAILQTKAEEIIFTSSGTEANNLAILGLARANKNFGNEIIISTIEHKAIIEAVKKLKNEGFVIKFALVNKNGQIDLKKIEKLVNKKTILVSIIYANNEIGTIQSLKKISQIIKTKNPQTIFHTDACQATNYLELSVKKLGVDALTLSSSKIYTPKGVGCLYLSNKYKVEPQIVGGDQEFKKRAGTENLPAIINFVEALRLSQKIKIKEVKRLKKIQKYFIKKIKQNISKVVINGSLVSRLPNNVNVSFVGAEGEALLLCLDRVGIACSTGSACSAQDLNPSHVLLAIGLPPELAHCSLRFSFGRFTTKKQINYTIKALIAAVNKIRKISVYGLRR